MKKTSLMFVFLFVISAVWGQSFSVLAQQRSGTGEFDISKVRRAARGRRTAPDTGKAELPSTQNLTAIVMRMVVSLAIILLVIAGLVYGIRRIALRGKPMGSRSGVLDVLETTGIMPGKSLCLVRVADRVLLLGVFQEGIRCLSEFEGEKALEIIQSTDKGNVPKLMSQFSDSLNIFVDRFRTKGESVPQRGKES